MFDMLLLTFILAGTGYVLSQGLCTEIGCQENGGMYGNTTVRVGHCSCNSACVERGTCCEDYVMVCLNGLYIRLRISYTFEVLLPYTYS